MPVIVFSTRPGRGATDASAAMQLSRARFQSTRPGRGATGTWRVSEERMCVSIHAPRTGRDHTQAPRDGAGEGFQSTRPGRGATSPADTAPAPGPCFNPRAPDGARRARPIPRPRQARVSIHAPRTGRDSARMRRMSVITSCFNPRAPDGARLCSRSLACAMQYCFNPRAPDGARLVP